MSLKLRKLMGMPPRELLFRVRHHWSKAAERRQYRAGGFNWSDAEWVKKLCHRQSTQPLPGELASWWQRQMQNRAEPVMLLAPEILPATVDLYHKLFPEQIESVETRAKLSCSGQFSFLGSDVVMEEPIDWLRTSVVDILQAL